MRDIGEPNRVANQNSAAYAAEPSARRQTQSRMRERIWLLLWNGLGILTLVLLSFDFIRIPDPFAASLPYHNDFLSCSGYKLIGFIGSKHWFVGCFALLFVLTCAAMAATGIVRYIRKDLDDTLGNIMAAEAYAYSASIAALYISHLAGKGEAFLIAHEAQLFVVLAVTVFFAARRLNRRYGGFLPTLKPPIHINPYSRVYAAFYGEHGAWLRSLAAIVIGAAIILLVQLFTGFSAFTDAKSSFNEVLDLPFTPISEWPDRSFEFYAQYGYTYILFLFLGKLVSRLTQNKCAVNETLESFVLYPGNVVLMLAVTSLASLPFLSCITNIFELFTTGIDKITAIGEAAIVPFNYIVALFLLLFFVLWIVLSVVVVFYGFFRLIKCVLLVFAAVIVFGLLLWGLSAIGGEPFQTAVDGILKAIAGNAFAKRTIEVALAVLLNDILDRTLDRKTDERIDDLIEKIKSLWAKLRAFPENRRQKRATRRQTRLRKQMEREK